MDERRRHSRFVVKGIHGNMFFTSKVEIINISLGGAAIQLNKSLMLGKEYSIKLEDKGKPIELKGTVVWSVLTGSQRGPHGDVIPVYHAGLRFDEILSAKLTELITFIEMPKTAESEERLRGIRFKIHTAKDSIIFYPSNYKVKLISLSGMLIETMQPFKPEDRYHMDLTLIGGKTVKFLGRIVSCIEIKDSSPKCYDIGVEFLEMSAEDKENISAFIHSISEEKGKTH